MVLLFDRSSGPKFFPIADACGSTTAFPVSNRYTGQIADDETGLYYYGGRYYDAQLGRFIQPDPTVPDPTDSQSLNRYSYCRNNPLNETDPTGFDDTGDGGGGGDSWSTFTWPGSDWSFGFGSINSQLGFSIDYNSSYLTLFANTVMGSSGANVDVGAILQPIMFDDAVMPGAIGQSSVTIPWGTSPSSPPEPPTSVVANDVSNVSNGSALAVPGSGSGGWLAGVTNAAGWLSMVPGPAGTVAGLINAAGEALQGNWGGAAIGIGGAALAVVGLGAVAKIGKISKAAEDGNFVYRGLAEGENAAGGLVARVPGAGNDVISHVAGKRASQWISTTKDLKTAQTTFGKNGVVAIDLNKVSSEVVDVSAGLPSVPKNYMLSRWARKTQEVLIKDRVPAEAVSPVH